MKLIHGRKALKEYVPRNGETFVQGTYISRRGFYHPATVIFEAKDFPKVKKK